MEPVPYRFGDFTLDPVERQLRQAGAAVELNARYFDALALMVRDAGALVSKDRFMDEVWRGIPVTDEALTQCIRTLRRVLGDDAARPRFIETVPKHGYRFVAPVTQADEGGPAPASAPTAKFSWRRFALIAGAGTAGGGVAGLIGGLFYGFVGAQAPQPGAGGLSVLLVLVSVTVLLALAGAAAVSFGIAAASGLSRRRTGLWMVVGGTAGGLLIGATVKLVGIDAFALLVGRSPDNVTGAAEGALLGGAAGLGVWLAGRSILFAGLSGAAAGLAIAAMGGRLLGGSLDLLAATFPRSQLRLDAIGAFVGEDGFGPRAQLLTGALEGALFTVAIAAAVRMIQRRL